MPKSEIKPWIAELDLPVRTYNALKDIYRYIEQVEKASDAELLAIQGFGNKSLQIVREKIVFFKKAQDIRRQLGDDQEAIRQWAELYQALCYAQACTYPFEQWPTVAFANRTDADGDPFIDWSVYYGGLEGASASGMADTLAAAIADMHEDAIMQGFLPDPKPIPSIPDESEQPDQEEIGDPVILDRHITAIESTCPRCGYIERVEVAALVGELQLMATMLKLVSACPRCYVADSGDTESIEADSILAQQEQEDFAHDNEIEFRDDGIFGEPYDEAPEVE